MGDCILQGTVNEAQRCAHPQATISDSQERKASAGMQNRDFTRNLKEQN